MTAVMVSAPPAWAVDLVALVRREDGHLPLAGLVEVIALSVYTTLRMRCDRAELPGLLVWLGRVGAARTLVDVDMAIAAGRCAVARAAAAPVVADAAAPGGER